MITLTDAQVVRVKKDLKQLLSRTFTDYRRINAASRIIAEIFRAERRRSPKGKPVKGHMTESFELMPD